MNAAREPRETPTIAAVERRREAVVGAEEGEGEVAVEELGDEGAARVCVANEVVALDVRRLVAATVDAAEAEAEAEAPELSVPITSTGGGGAALVGVGFHAPRYLVL